MDDEASAGGIGFEGSYVHDTHESVWRVNWMFQTASCFIIQPPVTLRPSRSAFRCSISRHLGFDAAADSLSTPRSTLP